MKACTIYKQMKQAKYDSRANLSVCLMYADVCGDLLFVSFLSFITLEMTQISISNVVLQIVELLSMEDVDITPEQIKDIVDLLEKESKLRNTSTEKSNSVPERTE